MSETAKLKLPLVAAAQAQKHVTVNEALVAIDAAVQLNVESRTLGSPPLVVVDGESYLVPVGAVNAWDQQDGKIASFVNGGWRFLTPDTGWQMWVEDEVVRLTFDGADWVENVLATSANKAAIRAEVIELDFDVGAGGGSVDTATIIPPNSSVFAVTGRVLTTITGDLSDWSLGIDGAETRYGSGLGLGSGSWLRGVTGHPVTYYTPAALRLTANGGSFTGGVVRLAVHMMHFDLPDGD
ncbi:DUF2793 domain-containing protein [uncultured Litoreibacter sp.]|uniref:DUF2793 domain-containing protein n=1 Tax=uncultured Litoreibacter sp. TaxID=1392394 RepID=UPI002630FED9|nr:DUF2793 domain-containing protein [uncultured Litoreibacter sp.]